MDTFGTITFSLGATGFIYGLVAICQTSELKKETEELRKEVGELKARLDFKAGDDN
jgi:hypothetical protein